MCDQAELQAGQKLSIPAAGKGEFAAAPFLALLLVTAVWGSTFFLIKDLVQFVPPDDFLGIRFAIAALLIVIFQFPRLRRASAQTWKQGAVLGGAYAIAQWLQTVGLLHTDASVSGFITGMYVVFTPLIAALVLHTKMSLKVWSAVLLATVGLGILSLRGFALGWGETLTLAGALMYAIHIILISRYTKNADVIALALIQIVFVGVFLGSACLFDGVRFPVTAPMWGSLLYMALFAGLGALVLQTWAQSRISATTAAIVMTTEPVFAAGFAVMFGGESLTFRLVLGGILVLTAMLLIETKSATSPDESAAENSVGEN
ncbi:DMT family transporter [Arcanobacterium hippocoleae]|uniref:Drug/metabolite transporter (DMT)-like permease n=1 Tax=Arcanobacterium hippocoleae TaxID=149017 RepID=A0ABU1T2Q1_9ACTO|nr:DMT family transporter [Arcanobacterium hippocoleae]MDR6939653.1 drug/metabolite transporter (DMT)-like permease [Arcanobacterium hippocoleae]